jgi:hypothetical protein
MRNSELNGATESQQKDIQQWIEEILADADTHQVRRLRILSFHD